MREDDRQDPADTPCAADADAHPTHSTAGGARSLPNDVMASRGTTTSVLLGRMLLCLAAIVLVGLLAMIRASHTIESSHDGLSVWLSGHPPRKMRHDAELLRRQRLAQLTEASEAELAEHVPAILASLGHSDHHVRRLAGGMLSRLESNTVTKYADAIAAHLAEADGTVRLHCIQALGLASPEVLRPHASQMFACLSDVDAGVRWAAVDALAGLEAKELATRAVGAVDALLNAGELSLAKSAVSSWASKLEGEPDVVAALGKINFHANFGNGIMPYG